MISPRHSPEQTAKLNENLEGRKVVGHFEGKSIEPEMVNSRANYTNQKTQNIALNHSKLGTRHLNSPEFGFDSNLLNNQNRNQENNNLKNVQNFSLKNSPSENKMGAEEFLTMDELNVLDQKNMTKKKNQRSNKAMLEDKFNKWQSEQ